MSSLLLPIYCLLFLSSEVTAKRDDLFSVRDKRTGNASDLFRMDEYTSQGGIPCQKTLVSPVPFWALALKHSSKGHTSLLFFA